MSRTVYEIIEAVCDRFKLSPFDVMRQTFDEVVDVWEGAVISAHSDKDKGAKGDAVQVYSHNATWH